jgi:hypothetical protein
MGTGLRVSVKWSVKWGQAFMKNAKKEKWGQAFVKNAKNGEKWWGKMGTGLRIFGGKKRGQAFESHLTLIERCRPIDLRSR